MENDLYKFNIGTKPHFAGAAKTVDTDIIGWHRSLGHASISKMKQVVPAEIKGDLNCETCVKGKLARKPFNSIGTRASEFLELVFHTDVCGPMSVNSMGGAKYFLIFIDDYNKMDWPNV